MIYIIAHGIKGPLKSYKAGAGWPAARIREKAVDDSTALNERCKHPFIPQLHICTINKNGKMATEIRIWDVIGQRFVFDRAYGSVTKEDLDAIEIFESK